jgi:hypothetical protein
MLSISLSRDIHGTLVNDRFSRSLYASLRGSQNSKTSVNKKATALHTLRPFFEKSDSISSGDFINDSIIFMYGSHNSYPNVQDTNSMALKIMSKYMQPTVIPIDACL